MVWIEVVFVCLRWDGGDEVFEARHDEVGQFSGHTPTIGGLDADLGSLSACLQNFTIELRMEDERTYVRF
jgi:hypothetical protein